MASASPIEPDPIRAALAGDTPRAALVTDIDELIDGAEPVTDADGLWSPKPSS
ncbi:hypothetical protein [Georgenia alba]|uniref:Uncharacterized protein n=1 Tax=Georgenia alba TaxID=2233858 RepID=A0ABW2Q3B9_9MICO